MTRTMVILGSMVLSLSMVASDGLVAEGGAKKTTHMKVSGVVSNARGDQRSRNWLSTSTAGIRGLLRSIMV